MTDDIISVLENQYTDVINTDWERLNEKRAIEQSLKSLYALNERRIAKRILAIAGTRGSAIRDDISVYPSWNHSKRPVKVTIMLSVEFLLFADTPIDSCRTEIRMSCPLRDAETLIRRVEALVNVSWKEGA